MRGWRQEGRTNGARKRVEDLLLPLFTNLMQPELMKGAWPIRGLANEITGETAGGANSPSQREQATVFPLAFSFCFTA